MKAPRFFTISFLGLTTIIFLCGGCSHSAPPISVGVSPSSAQTDQGQSVKITATLANDVISGAVKWTLTGPGSLANMGMTSVTYVAPSPSTVSSAQNATVTATSVADPSKTASAQITVNPLPQIVPPSLPNGTTGVAYSQTATESGGTPPFQWSVIAGAVPNGLTVDPNTGTVRGTPTGGGTWYFAMQVTDAAGVSSEDPFLFITVNSTAPPKNPVPFVGQPLVPDTATPAGSGFTLTVNGAGFVPGATVDFNGTALPTTFVNSRQITAAVPAAAIATPGTAAITVVNPAPAGPRSNPVYFPVATPEATLNFSNAPGSPVSTTISGGPDTLVIGDFTGTGKLDLVANFASNAVSVLLGNGDGTFGKPSLITMPSPPFNGLIPILSWISVGDFDNSGHPGLAVVDVQNSNVNILLGNGDGTFTHSSAFLQAGRVPSTLAVGDWNGDGNLDMTVAHFLANNPPSPVLGFGDGAFNDVVQIGPLVNDPANAIIAGDFNGDGKLDLAVTFDPNVLTILLGNGDGTFSQASGSPITVGNTPVAITACDFNGDGRLDLAVVNSSDNTVTILLGNGDGTFSPAPGSPVSVGNSPSAVGVGDFTGIGKPGLAVANAGDDNVSILLGNGDGTFSPAPGSPVATGKAPGLVAVGDFNGSGRLGLAVANSGDHTISILVQH